MAIKCVKFLLKNLQKILTVCGLLAFSLKMISCTELRWNQTIKGQAECENHFILHGSRPWPFFITCTDICDILYNALLEGFKGFLAGDEPIRNCDSTHPGWTKITIVNRQVNPPRYADLLFCKCSMDIYFAKTHHIYGDYISEMEIKQFGLIKGSKERSFYVLNYDRDTKIANIIQYWEYIEV